MKGVYAYLDNTSVSFAIDCTCSLSVSELLNIKVTCRVHTFIQHTCNATSEAALWFYARHGTSRLGMV